MLFTFEAFSLSLSVLGTIPAIKMLFVSLLEVIAKLRIPMVISSGVSMVLKSFAPLRRMILSSFCTTFGMTWDFISLVFAPLKCFTTTLRVRLVIFQSLMSLTIESPSMMVTGSFPLSGISLSVLSFEFCVLSSCIHCVLFCSYFLCLVSQFLHFRFQSGPPQFLMVGF